MVLVKFWVHAHRINLEGVYKCVKPGNLKNILTLENSGKPQGILSIILEFLIQCMGVVSEYLVTDDFSI